jgi:superfamily II DNA or RNA helicase
MELITKLWSHQEKLVKLFVEMKKGLFICPMGTGKTLIALACIKEINPVKTLIVAPKAVLSGWVRNIETHMTGVNYFLLSDMPVKDRLSVLSNEEQGVFITNYETLLDADLTGIDMIVLDESHKLGAYNSRISLAMCKSEAPYKLMLTATPYENKPTTLYGQLRFLDAEHFKNSKKYPQAKVFGHYDDFLTKYTTWYMHNGVQITDGYKNLNVLADTVKDYIVTISEEEAKVNKPAVHHINVYISLDKKFYKKYDELKRNLITEYEDTIITSANALTIGNTLQMFLSGIHKDEVVHKSPKIDVLLELIDNPEPVVSFTRYSKEVQELKKYIPDALCLTGDIKEHERWMKGEGRVLIVNINAGGAGVELHRANVAIYYSHTPDAQLYTQSTGRLARPDSKADKVTLYHLLPENTIEGYYLDIITYKQDLVKRINELLTTNTKRI